MPFPDEFQLVLVTPERTMLDEPVQALRFPLYDGQMGVLPGRAPLVGRLGYGELKITTAGDEQSYYIDGGFVQIKGNVVTLLTNRALRAGEIDPRQAEELLEDANARPATTDLDFAAKSRDQQRARRMLSVSRHG